MHIHISYTCTYAYSIISLCRVPGLSARRGREGLLSRAFSLPSKAGGRRLRARMPPKYSIV